MLLTQFIESIPSSACSVAICLSAPEASVVLAFLERGSLGRAPGPWGCCGPWFWAKAIHHIQIISQK